MRPVILYRESEFYHNPGELEAAETHFFCTPSRMCIKSGDLVIGRYSLLPYYEEQERDIEIAGARLINSWRQHKWIADVGSWACEGGALEGITPRTWTCLEDVPDGIQLVLKGQTNSKKFLWNSSMHAVDKAAAMKVYCKLLDDTLISQQQIYIREYVPLKRLATGFHGLPISKEFRVFVCYGEIVSSGFYWSSHVADLDNVPKTSEIPMDFLVPAIKAVSRHANFFAIDVAQKDDGGWVVIEINDGGMSGLSENDPAELYKNLKRVVSGRLGNEL